MEPVSIITALSVAFVRGVGGKVGSTLAAQLGLSSTETVAAQLVGIESRLATLQLQPHQENLRRGIALLRESAYQPDLAERSRRLRIAEDHLVVSASDSQLGFDDRASAALLAAVSSAERASPQDALRWLWASNSLLCAFVADRLHHQAYILADTAPAHIRADIEHQARSASPVVKFFTGHNPVVASLRYRLRTEAHEVLGVWSNIRAVLAKAEPDTFVPTPSITDEVGGYIPGIQPENEWTQLHIEIEGKRGVPTVGGGATLTVTELLRANDNLRISGRVQVRPSAFIYRSPYSGLSLGVARPPQPVGNPVAKISGSGGGLPGYTRSHKGARVGTLLLDGLVDGATFSGDFKVDRPFDRLHVWTSECEYTFAV